MPAKYNPDGSLNPEYFRAKLNRPKKDWYRAALASGIFPFTYNFPQTNLDKHIQCSYCGRFVHENQMTRDHVWPKSKGGTIKTPCCLKCNIEKEDMKPIEFAMWHSKTGAALPSIPLGEIED